MLRHILKFSRKFKICVAAMLDNWWRHGYKLYYTLVNILQTTDSWVNSHQAGKVICHLATAIVCPLSDQGAVPLLLYDPLSRYSNYLGLTVKVRGEILICPNCLQMSPENKLNLTAVVVKSSRGEFPRSCGLYNVFVWNSLVSLLYGESKAGTSSLPH